MDLAGLQWWAYLGWIAVIWSIIGGVLVILKNRASFSFGKSGVKITSSNSSKKKLVADIEVTLPMTGLIAIKEETAETERAIDRIVYYETVREQMRFIERQLKIARGRLRDKFLELRAEYLDKNESLLEDPIYKHYDTALEAAEGDLIHFARYVCGENHFLRRTPEEFDAYLESLKDEVREETTRALNRWYIAIEPPDRKAIQKANETIADELLNLFTKGIKHAKDVAYHKQEEVQNLRSSLDKQITQIVPEYQCVISGDCL